MPIPAVTLTTVIADSALAELANRQAAIDAAEARAALLERELAFVNERLADANALADRLALDNQNLRALAVCRRAAVIALTMQRTATVEPEAPAGVARSLIRVLLDDRIHSHEEACRELCALLSRGNGGRS
ncbi:hypothetical protein [Pseudomonas phage ZRG1]|nr:hypothetical protein [Pseudomonas phage ZRG1]